MKATKIYTIKSAFAYLFIMFDRLLSFFRLQKSYADRVCFKKIFYKAEAKALLGNNSRYFWMVSLLFFLTILAIGFANDSIRYLRQQMSDPFVKHVTANFEAGYEILAGNSAYQEFKSNEDSLFKYQYNSIFEFLRFREHFNGLGPFRGRTVETTDPLVDFILNYADNDPVGHGFKVDPQFQITESTNYGVIVTYDLLRAVNMTTDSVPFIQMSRGLFGRYHIPILAVVRQLPDNKHFIASPYFVDYVRNHESRFFRSSQASNKLFVMLDHHPDEAGKLKPYLDEALKWVNGVSDQVSTDSLNPYFLRPYTVAYRPTTLIQFNLGDVYYPPDLNEFFNHLMKAPAMANLFASIGKSKTSMILFYNPDGDRRSIPLGEYPARNAIGINFDDLKHVRMFANQFENDTGIALEMGRVRSLENYYFVTLLTLVVSAVLIIFSFISIALFVSNMIAGHLNKIKMNIGTYKAFGIQIRNIYKNMVFVFILVCQLFALLICYIIAELGLIYKLISLYNKEISDSYKFFYVYDWLSITILIAMILVSYFYAARVVNKLFDMSPGNLVYNREEQ